jgi:hypothetical protein
MNGPGCIDLGRLSADAPRFIDMAARELSEGCPGIVDSFRYHVRNVVRARTCLRLSYKLLQFKYASAPVGVDTSQPDQHL